jgi:hypothetical protein
VSSRQFEHARMGAGRWERSQPKAARLVSQSNDRLTTADGSSRRPRMLQAWAAHFTLPGRLNHNRSGQDWPAALRSGKVVEYGAEAAI